MAAAFPPLFAATASLAAPLVAALAVLGFVLSSRWRSWPPDAWAALAAAGAYCCYALPVVLSGRATFAGYIKLDDTATYLAMIDRSSFHGRDLASLAPSTYEATLATTLGYGYPVGSFAPLGALERLVGIDAAWLWQPYLAFLGALLALALYALLGGLVASRPVRAVAAVVAAQPALLFGYSLWGGIKELAAAALVATLATVAVLLLREDAGPRAVLPLAAASAAVAAVLSLGGAAWLLLLLPAVILVAQARGIDFAALAAGAFALAVTVLSIPAIVAAFDWLPHSGAFTSEDELANLSRPLRLAQIAGVWLAGDFRRGPDDAAPTYVLIAVVVAAAVGGAVWAWTRRSWPILLYGAGALGGALFFYAFGSPWIAGKGLATGAPAVVLLACAGAAALLAGGRRVEAAVLGLAIVAGVAWSNALAYREVWLAPQDRLSDLESIGERYAEEGPALMTEFEPYGARHFLRRLDPEGTSELRRHVIPLLDGQPLEPQAYADLDRFQLGGILFYRTLVLRRSPTASRPSSAYRLAERRRWYEVWQRPVGRPRVLVHLPLGTDTDPGAVPNCADVVRLASQPGVTALAAVERSAPVLLDPTSLSLPSGWTPSFEPMSIAPRGSGSLAGDVEIPEAGRYDIWLGGSYTGRAEAVLDGRAIGSSRRQLEWPGQYVDLGGADLEAGTHRLALRYDEGGWRPGSKGLAPFPLGPLALARDDERDVFTVAPADAHSLCGRRLDWVEALG